jgi:hypothetical protein
VSRLSFGYVVNRLCRIDSTLFPQTAGVVGTAIPSRFRKLGDDPPKNTLEHP